MTWESYFLKFVISSDLSFVWPARSQALIEVLDYHISWSYSSDKLTFFTGDTEGLG